MGKHRKRADPEPWTECPVCHSRAVQFKKTTNSWWCRKCGAEWGIDWVDPPKSKGAKS